MGKGLVSSFVAGFILIFGLSAFAAEPTAIACEELFTPPEVLEIGKESIAPYYQDTEDSRFFVAGQAVTVNHISQNSAEELRLQVYTYFSKWLNSLNRIKEQRALDEKELATFDLVSKAQKKLVKPEWFHKKAIEFSSFVEGAPEYELGAYAHLFIVDLLFSSADRLDLEKWEAGEVAAVKQPSNWPKKARAFVADRFKKKYTNQILWWGPMLIIYVKWGDQIMAYLEALLK